jgi:hypothetical protein
MIPSAGDVKPVVSKIHPPLRSGVALAAVFALTAAQGACQPGRDATREISPTTAGEVAIAAQRRLAAQRSVQSMATITSEDFTTGSLAFPQRGPSRRPTRS